MPCEGAEAVAQRTVIEVAKRLSGKTEDYIQERIQENLWLAGGDRPEEPDRP